MRPVRIIEGRAYRLGLPNVDTDMIIAAPHLKTISRSGLGRFAFGAMRQQPGHAFEPAELAGAPILIAGDNFGCGSSREHAVWAIQDMGIEAVVAPGFSDIFAGNAFKNGLLTVQLTPGEIERILLLPLETSLKIDLEAEELLAAEQIFPFKSDPFRRECLLAGRDEIDLTLTKAEAITKHEREAVVLSWAISRPDGRMGA